MENRTQLELFWNSLYQGAYGGDDFKFAVFGTSLYTGVLFYSLCGFFMLVDLTGRPKWMLRYKVQPGANEPIDREKLWRTVKLVTFNQFVVSGPWLVLVYYAQTYMGSSCRTEDLPGILTIIRDLICFVIMQETIFYYMHRLFHWGPLYKHVHKIHHEWQSPASGIVAVSAHPLEHLLVNLPEATLGPVLMGSHRFTTLLWYTWATVETIMSHSGYHLPFSISPEFHDFHHLKFNGNYGIYGWLDGLHGTDRSYRVSVQKKRDHILCGLTPMSEQFPVVKHKKAQ